MKTTITAALALAALAATGLAAGPEFALHDGDRVVFLGDSITEQKLYTTHIEAYTLTRFPKLKINFYGRGWGGDTSWLRMRSFPDEKVLFAAGLNEVASKEGATFVNQFDPHMARQRRMPGAPEFTIHPYIGICMSPQT